MPRAFAGDRLCNSNIRLVAVIGLLFLSGCATAVAPPGKSQTQLNAEGAICSNPNDAVFAQCMLRFGNAVRMPDGRVLTPAAAPPMAYRPPPMAYRPLPASAPALRPENGVSAGISRPDLDQTLDELVAADSRSWAVNHYDAGSMRNVHVVDVGSVRTARGNYSYNGGKPGWVEVELTGLKKNKTSLCIRYWDFPGACRQPGRGLLVQLEEANARAAREAARHPQRQTIGTTTSGGGGFVNGPSLCNLAVHGSVLSWNTPLNPCNDE